MSGKLFFVSYVTCYVLQDASTFDLAVEVLTELVSRHEVWKFALVPMHLIILNLKYDIVESTRCAVKSF